MHKSILPSLRLAIFVSLGGFLFGFDASVISGVVGFVVPEFELNDWQQGLVVSAPTLAAILASITFAPLSDVIGRKKVLISIAFLYVLSAVTSALAPSFIVLVLARAVGGLAFASLILAPMYIAEVSPPKQRGLLVSVNQLNIMIGFSVAYFANFLILRASGSEAAWATSLGIDKYAWRWMLGLEALPALAYFLLLFTIPESPRWLIVKNRLQEAKQVLARLVSPEQLDKELQEIQQSVIEAGRVAKSRLSELLNPKLRMAFVVAIVVGIAQQITGINAVYFYAPSIFEQSGVGTDAAFAQAVWIGIINLVFTVIAMVSIDKIGRKPLLIIGLSGVLVSMSVASYGFQQASYQLTDESVQALSEDIDRSALDGIVGSSFKNDVEYKNALREVLGETRLKANESELIQAAVNMNPMIILFGILGFVGSFAVSLGPVMWVLFSEIFPNRIRGMAIAAVGLINSSVSFLVQFLFPWELSNLGTALTFLIYGLFALVGVVLVAWLLPETKGKSLEEIEHQFTGS